MALQETKKLADQVYGWLSDKEGELLYNFAKKCSGKGAIVEIGSWKGKSTIWLGKGSKAGNKVRVYAIDPHTGSLEHKKLFGKIWTFEEFKRNIHSAKVDDIVTPLVKTSKKVAQNFKKPVEFIFIDGDHDYKSVKLDFDLWFPKVIEYGVMAFHDTIDSDGPRKLVKELLYKSKNFKNVCFVNSTTYAQKVKQNSLKDRIRNRYFLVLKNAYEFTRKLHFPQPLKNFLKKIVRVPF